MSRKLATLSVLWLLSFVFAVATPKYEIRAVWLTSNWGLDWPSSPIHKQSDIVKQKRELNQLLDKIQALNFNVVFFQVRLRGDVIYPSLIEPWNHIMTGSAGRDPGYDPLSYAISECHSRGLECHAWMVCMPLGSDQQVRKHGRNSVVSKYPELCIKQGSEWFLDPGNPQTPIYLSRLVKELVSKYDVDGVHLDYIRYPDQASTFPDSRSYRKYAAPGESLAHWRRQNISRIVTSIYDEAKRIKPWVKVSSATLGKYNTLPNYSSLGWSCMETVHQDAQEWLRRGKQDFIVPMLYYPGQHFYPFLSNWIDNRSGRFVVSGLGAYRLERKEGNWSLSDFMDQIYRGRESGVDGQAFYRAGSLLNDYKNIYGKLQTSVYRYPALFPPLVFLDSVPPMVPQSFTVDRADGYIDLSWNQVEGAKGYVIYGSDHFPVDTDRAENIINSYVENTDLEIDVWKEWSKVRTYYAVTAFDYYHNESKAVQYRNKKNPVKRVEYNKSLCKFEGDDIPDSYNRISVSDLFGKKVCERDMNNIDLSDLHSGVYSAILIGGYSERTRVLLYIR